MYNYKLFIAYEGTRYSGWQKQGNTENTIQHKIESVLEKLFSEPIELHGSGRTDAGVHARCQVANFKTHKQEDIDKLSQYLNAYLPQDIRILSVVPAKPEFHARLRATGKHYHYRIDNGIVADVFFRKFSTRFTERDYFYSLWQQQKKQDTVSSSKLCQRQIPYDLPAMRNAASLLLGQQDFRSFCDNKRMKKSTIRTLEKIAIEDNQGILTFDFYGDGFLYHMVRILTGTLLEVGIGIIKPEDIPSILAQKNREVAGFTAPPQGLFLCEVFYDHTSDE